MLTLTYGYKKPQLDDTGDVFFPAMEGNIQQLNDHVHDGVTSAILPTANASIAHGAWTAVGGFPGLYTQVVALPTGRLYDTTQFTIRDSSGNVTNNQITKASASTYNIFTNDNTQDLLVQYGV